MNEKLKNLYQELILVHSRQPVHFGKRPDAAHIVKAYNPLCGDSFTFYVDIEGERFSQLSFHGMGCAISKASASVMVQMLQNQGLDTAKQKSRQFLEMLETEPAESDLPAEMLAFSAARDFPGRKKCASLAWEELLTFLLEQEIQ